MCDTEKYTVIFHEISKPGPDDTDEIVRKTGCQKNPSDIMQAVHLLNLYEKEKISSLLFSISFMRRVALRMPLYHNSSLDESSSMPFLKSA